MSNPRIRKMYTLTVNYRLGAIDADDTVAITRTQSIEVVNTYQLVLLDQDGNPLQGFNITRVNTVDAMAGRVVARFCVTQSYFGSRTVSTYSLSDPIFTFSDDTLIVKESSVMNGTIPLGSYLLSVTLNLNNNEGTCPHTLNVDVYVDIVPGEFVHWYSLLW